MNRYQAVLYVLTCAYMCYWYRRRWFSIADAAITGWL